MYFGNRNWHPFVEDTVAADARPTAFGGPRCSPPRPGAATPAARSTRRTSPGPAPRSVTARRNWSEAAPVLRPSAAGRDVRRRDRRGRRRPCPRRCATRPGWCSPRTRSRCARPIALRARPVRRVRSRYTVRLWSPPPPGYADYDLVWQSRSGPPQVPWLEPDVGDHLSALAEAGTKAVIVCPIGFVADHIEVVWDLDSELAEQADDAGRRAAPGHDARTRSPASPGWRSTCSTRCATGREPARVVGAEPVPGYGSSVNGRSAPRTASGRAPLRGPVVRLAARPTAGSR